MLKNHINGKRTKIVATLGPSSTTEATIRQLIRSGMDVARINFSHGEHHEHAERIATVRRICEEEGALVAILADIQGPKIRIGQVAGGGITLTTGDKITLTLDEGAVGENNIVTLPHPEFVKDVHQGATLLLDDGNFEFEVMSNTGRSLICQVRVGGLLTSRKGVMATNARLTLSAITEKDSKDIAFALSQNVDYVAMSFVRTAEEVREMKFLIRHLGGTAAVISKIEKFEALEQIEEIIAASDAIMVARGDLGLEIPAEQVPYEQKRIIKLCNAEAKPVIVATQMLNSMTASPRPTRAEASDVYNAILDGTDAVMLSNETASGQYPVKAVETMANIASIAERDRLEHRQVRERITSVSHLKRKEAVSDAVSRSTCDIADVLGVKAIVTSTLSGYTTRQVAKERPETPIICVTPSELTYQQMILVWGVYPLLIPTFNTIDEMIHKVVRAAHETGHVNIGDNLVIIAGTPFNVGGQTNFLKVHTVGEMGELDGM